MKKTIWIPIIVFCMISLRHHQKIHDVKIIYRYLGIPMNMKVSTTNL